MIDSKDITCIKIRPRKISNNMRGGQNGYREYHLFFLNNFQFTHFLNDILILWPQRIHTDAKEHRQNNLEVKLGILKTQQNCCRLKAKSKRLQKARKMLAKESEAIFLAVKRFAMKRVRVPSYCLR